MNNNYAEMIVLATEAGDNYHIFADCRALAQGRRNSVKFGRDLSGEFKTTAQDAIDDGKFACRLCHKAAGLDIPVEADRKVARASRKAARALAAATKAKAAEVQAAVAVQTAQADKTEAAVATANHALTTATYFARRAQVLANIAAVYRVYNNDQVRWNAATERFIPVVK